MYPRDGLVKDSELMSVYEFLAVGSRAVFLSDEITFKEGSAVWLPDTLLALDKWSHDPIKLYIASPGGAIQAGLVIYDTMKMLKSPIYTIGRYCLSLAAVLLAAGDKGHRYVLPHARIVLHLPRGNIAGDTKDLEIYTKEITRVKDTLAELLIDCGVKRKKRTLLADMDREFWLNAEEAIEYGLADKIMNTRVYAQLVGDKAKPRYQVIMKDKSRG